MTSEEKLRAEAAREAFRVTDVEDRDGGGRSSDVRLTLQTLGMANEYWLESGSFQQG